MQYGASKSFAPFGNEYGVLFVNTSSRFSYKCPIINSIAALIEDGTEDAVEPYPAMNVTTIAFGTE
jgi:hypothetical protein